MIDDKPLSQTRTWCTGTGSACSRGDDDGDVDDGDDDDDVGDRKWDKIETSMVFGSRRGHIPVSMSAQVQVVGGNCDHLEIVNITSSTILVLVLVDSSRIISFWQPLQPL